MGGVVKGQKHADVIHGWSLIAQLVVVFTNDRSANIFMTLKLNQLMPYLDYYYFNLSIH